MKNNAGVSVWETSKFRAKMIIKKAPTHSRLHPHIYVTIMICKNVSTQFKAKIMYLLPQACMKGKMAHFLSLTIWISMSFMNPVQRIKPHRPKLNCHNFSLISLVSSTKIFWLSRTYLHSILMKSRQFYSTWKSPVFKYSNKKYIKGFLMSRTRI